MLSKSASKGFSIDDASFDTTESSASDVTSELPTTACEPVRVQTLAETESVDNFMHNTDHLSFVVKDIGTGSEISSTESNLTSNGSTGTRSS